MDNLTNKVGQDKIDLQVLKESEARFRSIVLWSPDAIIVTDEKEKIEYINPAAERFFNRKMGSFVGQDFGLPLVDGERVEIDIFRPGKEPGVGDMHVVEAEWLNKKVHLITIRDITERKRAEQVIRESEEKFRAIFDNATDGILLADLETKKFFSANKTICNMLGYSLDEIKELGVMDIHPKKDLPYVIDQFEKQSRKEITTAKDIPAKRRDGSVFYAEVNSSPVILGGKQYLIGIFRDITERKQAEKEQGKHIQELEILAKATTGRELKMMELEKDVNDLLRELGRETKYKT